MASLPLYTQNEIYNLVPGEVNWKKGDTVQILPTFPYCKDLLTEPNDDSVGASPNFN